MLWYLLALALLDLILVLAALFLCVLTVVWSISLWTDVPYVPTPRKKLSAIFEALDIHDGDVVYELGSGDGRFTVEGARAFPGATFVGLERNPLLHAGARLRKRFSGDPANATLRRGDFFEEDLAQATKIYGYLLRPVMRSIEPKCEREFRGRFASRAFQFVQKKPARVVTLSQKEGHHGEHLLYVYDF